MQYNPIIVNNFPNNDLNHESNKSEFNKKKLFGNKFTQFKSINQFKLINQKQYNIIDETQYNPIITNYIDETQYNPIITNHIDETQYNPIITNHINETQYNPIITNHIDETQYNPIITNHINQINQIKLEQEIKQVFQMQNLILDDMEKNTSNLHTTKTNINSKTQNKIINNSKTDHFNANNQMQTTNDKINKPIQINMNNLSWFIALFIIILIILIIICLFLIN